MPRFYTHLNPSTVSWLSLFVITLIISGIGLTGSHFMFRSLESEFLLHNTEHNKDPADRLAKNLHVSLSSGLPPEIIVDRFREEMKRIETIVNFTVFLIDHDFNNQIIVHSDARMEGKPWIPSDIYESWENLTQPDLDETKDLHGAFKAVSTTGEPLLEYFVHILHNDKNNKVNWIIGVQTDQSEIIASFNSVAQQVNIVLLVSASLIGLLGFMTVRYIGRGYEKNLELTVTKRTLELEEAQAEILQKTQLATIGQTATVITHEMRNPLASIKLALSSVVHQGQLSELDEKKVNIALREVDRLNNLLTETLDSVRPIKLSDTPLHIDTLLDHALNVMEPLIEKHSQILIRDICTICPPIHLDSAKITQALINLLKNASEACPPSGTIHVSLKSTSSVLELTFENDGPQIPEDMLSSVFEPFQSSKPSGTGLGLTVVKHVIEGHKGYIRITSIPDSTTLSIYLPVAYSDFI